MEEQGPCSGLKNEGLHGQRRHSGSVMHTTPHYTTPHCITALHIIPQILLSNTHNTLHYANFLLLFSYIFPLLPPPPLPPPWLLLLLLFLFLLLLSSSFSFSLFLFLFHFIFLFLSPCALHSILEDLRRVRQSAGAPRTASRGLHQHHSLQG
jgi:hypothetical protein